MASGRSSEVMRRFDAAELALCLYLNRGCSYPQIRELFGIVSRLGDGVLWYVLIFALPVLYPHLGVRPSVHMAAAGMAGVLIYKLLKHSLVRERPFISHAAIRLGIAPLDRYSFPSGHTLHAVSFTTLATGYVPELAVLLVPFAALVAASRVILGLHYPTDVVAGAALGFALARISVLLS